MSWKFYVYVPTEGVSNVQIGYIDKTTTSFVLETTVAPAGSSTACWSDTAVPDGYGVVVVVNFVSDAYQVSQWVLNVDGSVSYEGAGLSYFSYFHSGASAVHVRAEILAQPTYYATLSFDANGGSGAPSSITNSTVGSSTVVFTIPSTVPTRSGYTFTGWKVAYTGGSTVYQPGNTASVEGTTSGITYTLVAQWTESAGGAHIYASGWNNSSVYIYVNGWKKATPYVYANGWKKGV